jgi:8-oxo-dGTP diphosphatase
MTHYEENIMRITERATVVYLKRPDGCFCLAPKKGNIHKAKGEELKGTADKLNGYGGKQKFAQTILQTAISELFEESSVRAGERDLELVGRINFFWPDNDTTQPDMIVDFFFISVYQGEPRETVEMGPPEWFLPENFPYDRMNKADKYFLPSIFKGEKKVLDIFHGKTREDGTPLIVDKEIAPTL